MSEKAQIQNLLKMSVSDKKMLRLINCSNLSDKDMIFINNAYEQKQQIHFRYGIGFTMLSTLMIGRLFTRFSPVSTQLVVYGGFGMLQHLFWSARSTHRMQSLLASYFQKYEIK